MKWNPDLAELSQKWANHLQKSRKCKMKHSANTSRENIAGFQYVGENLYWYWSSYKQLVSPKTARDAVDAWYSEIKYYQYSPKGVICSKRAGGSVIGHFTQLMWEKSVNLGCAYAQCGDGTSVVVVCNYGPAGNFNIQRTPPFSESAAAKLNTHEVNKKYGGLPSCNK